MKVWILFKFGFRSKSKSLDFLRRTRATGLYRDGVDITVIATLLGHSQVQTTKDHYALPSIEQMRAAMELGAGVEPAEQQLWSDDENEIAKLCGLN